MTTSGPHDVSGPETIRYNTAAIHANYEVLNMYSHPSWFGL